MGVKVFSGGGFSACSAAVNCCDKGLGWRLSGSSDVWIGSEREATNPFFSIWCCLKRETYTGAYIDEHEAITLEQALRMHTIDIAWAMGEDDPKGGLAPGKLADIIALDREPF